MKERPTFAVASQETPEEDAQEEAQEASQAHAAPADEAGQVGAVRGRPARLRFVPALAVTALFVSPRSRAAAVLGRRSSARPGRVARRSRSTSSDGVQARRAPVRARPTRPPAWCSPTCCPPTRPRGIPFAPAAGGAGLPGAHLRLPRLLPRRRRRVLGGDEAGRCGPVAGPAGRRRPAPRRRGRHASASRARDGRHRGAVVVAGEPDAGIPAVVTLSAPQAIEGLAVGPELLHGHHGGQALHRRAR